MRILQTSALSVALALAISQPIQAHALEHGPRLALGQAVPPPPPFIEMCESGAGLAFCHVLSDAPAEAPSDMPLPLVSATSAPAGPADGAPLSVEQSLAAISESVGTKLAAFALSIAPQPALALAVAVAAPVNDMRLLSQINFRVNSHVRQVSDMEHYGRPDVWTPSGDGPGASGDCEDIAAQKRLELLAQGFPADKLAFALVFSRNSGLHVVLVADTDKETYVLDSRQNRIEAWTSAAYSWIAMQSAQQPMLWRSVLNAHSFKQAPTDAVAWAFVDAPRQLAMAEATAGADIRLN